MSNRGAQATWRDCRRTSTPPLFPDAPAGRQLSPEPQRAAPGPLGTQRNDHGLRVAGGRKRHREGIPTALFSIL